MKATGAANTEDLLLHAGWLRRFAVALVKLKSQFSRQQFEGICGLYTTPLRKGYRLEYLGQLRQRGAFLHLWKISVVDGQDETLIRLVMKDGKVSGFGVF